MFLAMLFNIFILGPFFDLFILIRFLHVFVDKSINYI